MIERIDARLAPLVPTEPPPDWLTPADPDPDTVRVELGGLSVWTPDMWLVEQVDPTMIVTHPPTTRQERVGLVLDPDPRAGAIEQSSVLQMALIAQGCTVRRALVPWPDAPRVVVVESVAPDGIATVQLFVTASDGVMSNVVGTALVSDIVVSDVRRILRTTRIRSSDGS